VSGTEKRLFLHQCARNVFLTLYTPQSVDMNMEIDPRLVRFYTAYTDKIPFVVNPSAREVLDFRDAGRELSVGPFRDSRWSCRSTAPVASNARGLAPLL